MKWWDRMPWSSFSECWALSQVFHSPLSLARYCIATSSLLEKATATHSSIFAWKISWTEEPGGLQSMGCKELGTTEWLTLTRQNIKKQRHYFANKGPSSQGYGFSSSHVWMWELDCKESWALEELMLLNCGVWEDSRVSWISRRSDQSILKEISPGCSLEGLML